MIPFRVRTSFLPSFAILLALCSMAFVPTAKADIVPWLTGFFPSTDGFSMGTTFGDSFANIVVSPDLPVITVDWQCNDLGICVGQGSAPITSGGADGQIWSVSLGTLQATFTGHVTGGAAVRYEQYCPDDICLTYFVESFHADFSGTWSNGWHTVGFGEGTFGSDTTGSGLFYLSTYTPEPTTLTLLGLGIAGLGMRLRRRL
jgi:hypothetical protein